MFHRKHRGDGEDLDRACAHHHDYDGGDCQEYYRERTVDAGGAEIGVFESKLEVGSDWTECNGGFQPQLV